jgi:hypothetical protein
LSDEVPHGPGTQAKEASHWHVPINAVIVSNSNFGAKSPDRSSTALCRVSGSPEVLAALPNFAQNMPCRPTTPARWQTLPGGRGKRADAPSGTQADLQAETKENFSDRNLPRYQSSLTTPILLASPRRACHAQKWKLYQEKYQERLQKGLATASPFSLQLPACFNTRNCTLCSQEPRAVKHFDGPASFFANFVVALSESAARKADSCRSMPF